MVEIAVTDTHALLWALQGKHRKLGRDARRVFERADEGTGVVYLPTIALVEVGQASHKGTVPLRMGFHAWVDALFSLRGYEPADLTTAAVLRGEELYAIPERSDRLIAATALELDLPLITRHPEIGRVAGVRAIW